MTTSCPQCGQSVLPDELECWQCGSALGGNRSGRSGAEGAAASPAGDAPVSAAAAPAGVRHLPTTVVYSLYTLLLVVLALALLRALGRQPLLQVVPGYARPAGWVSVTAPDQTFTLDLPAGWSWTVGDDLASLPAARRAQLLDLGQPLLSDGATLALVAWSDGEMDAANARLVIARDGALSSQTPDEALRRAEAADLETLSASVVEGFARSRAELLLTRRSPAWGSLRCRQLFVPVDGAGLVLAVCGGPDPFRLEARDVELILDSFQPLVGAGSAVARGVRLALVGGWARSGDSGEAHSRLTPL